MTLQEAYRILGVSPGASPDQIKHRYRKLARKHHPDMQEAGDRNDVEIFYLVQQAYDVLKDGDHAREQLGIKVNPVAPWPGDRLPLAAVPVGSDVTGTLHISFHESFAGTSAQIPFSDQEGCERCGATGVEPGAGWMPCPPCSQISSPSCPWCAGEGSVPQTPCQACLGAGAVDVERSVRVSVPRSIRDGQVLRIKNRGRWGLQRSGDLRLTVHVEEDLHFRRLGDDAEIDVEVDSLDALLGGKAIVPRLDGQTMTIAIPPHTNSGRRFRIAGHGFYHKAKDEEDDRRGDLYARVQLTVPGPDDLSDDEKRLYEQIRSLGDLRVSAVPPDPQTADPGYAIG